MLTDPAGDLLDWHGPQHGCAATEPGELPRTNLHLVRKSQKLSVAVTQRTITRYGPALDLQDPKPAFFPRVLVITDTTVMIYSACQHHTENRKRHRVRGAESMRSRVGEDTGIGPCFRATSGPDGKPPTPKNAPIPLRPVNAYALRSLSAAPITVAPNNGTCGSKCDETGCTHRIAGASS
jgi:hypothetical protein